MADGRNPADAPPHVYLSYYGSSDTPHYGNDVPFDVPEGWAWCRLGDIAYIAAGSTPPKNCFVEYGIPYIKMYNLRNQKIDFDFHPQYIDYTTHTESLRRSMTQVGDIIMNIVGPPLGKLAIIPNDLPEANFNQAAVLIRPLLHKCILNKYIFRYLEQMSEINSISTKGSAGQVNISLTQSQNIRIPLPPLNEQKRIVEEIDLIFALVESLEHNEFSLKKTIQKAKSKILDLALSGCLTSDTSHYGKWPHLPLSEIFHITMGQSPESCHINHIKDGVEFHQGKLHFGHKYLQDSGIYTDNEMKVADAHSLLMCVRAPVGVINITERRICIGRGLCALKLKNPSMPIGYWYYALSSLSRYFEEKSTGSTFKAITMDVIRNTQIRVPPIIEQEAIVRQLEQIDEIVDKILAIK